MPIVMYGHYGFITTFTLAAADYLEYWAIPHDPVPEAHIQAR